MTGLAHGESLDPLRAAQLRALISSQKCPDLFGVGLEKDFEQALARNDWSPTP